MDQELIAPSLQLEGTLRTWIDMVGIKILLGHLQAKGYSVAHHPLSQETWFLVSTATALQSDLAVSLSLSEPPLCVIWFSAPIGWGGA